MLLLNEYQIKIIWRPLPSDELITKQLSIRVQKLPFLNKTFIFKTFISQSERVVLSPQSSFLAVFSSYSSVGQEREVFVPPFEWQYYVTLLPTCFSFFSFSCSDGLKNKSFLPLNSACLINLPVALLVEMFCRQFKVNSATSSLKQPFGASSLLILDS